ncbi:uncharacterized protein FIBRA_04767 [Fibroporia radiculosa]|uniref:Uncharacterized protein n=1 Tax=Fibroporia radiculosa TaxID=599839 RepID=J4G7X4_9APHY|nr:uncharacterized protein FIBRA_04767 [Fibroporia radiculosa]CCM02663.1 predicted protein [Fibroporia radiculosa]
MDFNHSRTPTTATTRTRPPLPHGPRMPNNLRGPKSTPKGIISFDVYNRVEEATPAYSSPRTSTCSPSSSRFSVDRVPPLECGSSAHSAVSKGVQTSVGEPITPATPSTASPVVKVIKKTVTLKPPPAVNFESVPVPWRGMSLQTAQWSLTSRQLQEIVSTAIRTSAQESFIRLVPLQTLDEQLTAELERLESLRTTTQAQYRFNVQRRMMLLQSLNALSTSQSPDAGDREAIGNLTAQLAEVAASCDRLMETLLILSDQRAQIQRLQDVHIASALAMALRKLNTSYSRRASELDQAKIKIEELKAELEEAWQVAEEMAQEMDDLDNFDFGYDDEVLETTSAVIGETRTEQSVQLAEVMEITGTAVATKAKYTNAADGQSSNGDRAGRVTAARRRSIRTSKASLRLPKTPSTPGEQSTTPSRRARSRSKSCRRPSMTADGNVPQVPIIRIDSTSSYKDDSFLELSETRPASPTSSASPQSPPPLPQTLVIDAKWKRDTLELPAPSPNPTLPSPGFDRTIIPPLTLRGSKDDAFYATPRELDVAAGRRVQSMQPLSRSDTLPEMLLSALRRTRSDSRKLGRALQEVQKPARYSVPLRATNEVEQPVQAKAYKLPEQPATEVPPSPSSQA